MLHCIGDPNNQTQQSKCLVEIDLRAPLESSQIFQACVTDYYRSQLIITLSRGPNSVA
jgi:hypothetical protein